MPKHVTVNREGKARTLANARDQRIDGVWCERAAPLGRKTKPLPGNCRQTEVAWRLGRPAKGKARPREEVRLVSGAPGASKYKAVERGR